MKIFIFFDNGVSGSIGIINEMGEAKYFKTPVFKQLSYTKKEKFITRINGNKLFELLEPYSKDEVRVMLERPLNNPKFWTASLSALRELEATLIVIEKLGFKYEYIDSTEWQNKLLPEYYNGKLVEKEVLKEASLGVAKELFPQIDFTQFKDGDGILGALYCKQKYGEINV